VKNFFNFLNQITCPSFSTKMISLIISNALDFLTNCVLPRVSVPSCPHHMSEQMKQGPYTISTESHVVKSQTLGLIKLTKVWKFQTKWPIRSLPSGYVIQWRHCQIKFSHGFVAVWQIWRLTIQLNLSRPMARLLRRMKSLRYAIAMMTGAHRFGFLS
jgi:hypothetical protein